MVIFFFSSFFFSFFLFINMYDCYTLFIFVFVVFICVTKLDLYSKIQCIFFKVQNTNEYNSVYKCLFHDTFNTFLCGYGRI